MSTTNQLSFIVADIVLAVAAYRGIEIGRAFTSRLYRSRATWAVAIVLVAFLSDLTNIVPFSTLLSSLSSFILLVMLILVVFVFVDVSILTTIELDFFHSNTLRWRQGRFVGYLLLFGDVGFVFLVGSIAGLPGTPAWINSLAGSSAFNAQAGLAIFGVLAYSAAALIVGARRTRDKTMKRHLLLVGSAFLLFIVSTLNDLTFAIELLNDFLALLGPCVIYLALMALSPVGRVEKEVAGKATHASEVGAAA